jgi:exopolysaccharide biosynthesis polyprenyl glycosylphosphotransferase
MTRRQAEAVRRPDVARPEWKTRFARGADAAARVAAAIGEETSKERVRHRDAAYRRTLAVADLVSALAALTLGVAVFGDDSLTLAVLVFVPLILVVGKSLGLYDRDEHLLRKTTLEEAPKLFQVATLYALLTWIFEGAFVDGHLGNDQVLALWMLVFCSMTLGRGLGRRLVRRITAPERCLVVGNRSATDRVAGKFAVSSTVKANVVGRVPFAYGNRRGEDQPDCLEEEAAGPNGIGAPVLGDLPMLDQLIESHAVDRVVIAPSAGASDELLEIVRRVKTHGVKVSVLPRLFEVVGSSAAFDDVDGVTLLGIRRYGLSRSSRALKRAMDIVGAGAALLVIAPLLAVISIAIKLDSGGPSLFRQRRIGKDEREFEMLKFRTMAQDAERQKSELEELNEAVGLFKIADDPRVTRVGRFLRRTSLDELPQLFNVLKGEMSLVGPRPLVPDDDQRVEGLDRRRLHMMPGMTGHWQILGSSRIPLHEMVKIDYLYAMNWSVWGDLRILLRTVPHVLGRRGL